MGFKATVLEAMWGVGRKIDQVSAAVAVLSAQLQQLNDTVQNLGAQLKTSEDKEMAGIQDVQQHLDNVEMKASAIEAEVGNAVAVLQGLSAALQAANLANDPAAVQAVIDRMDKIAADLQQKQQDLATGEQQAAQPRPPTPTP